MTSDDPESEAAPFETSDEALRFLREIGTMKDEEIDLGEAALALGLIFLPGLNVERYRLHLHKLGDHVREEYNARLRLGEADDVQLRAAVLRKVIHEAHGYRGDEQDYDDIQNANLIRVIERRKGLPVALGIIYLVLARRMGWDCAGLSFPGHFLLRLAAGGDRVILDPFREGREMNAAALRELLKSIIGKEAELSHAYYEAVPNRDILVRLENNLKKRLIDGEDYAQAIIVAEAIGAFSPLEYRVHLDKGVLYAKLGQRQQAISALETYMSMTPHPKERQQASYLIEQIKNALD